MQELPNGLYPIDKQEEAEANDRARHLQRALWRLHRDELVGVPEVDPLCNVFVAWMMRNIW